MNVKLGQGSPNKSERALFQLGCEFGLTSSLMMSKALKAKLWISEGSRPNLLTFDIKKWQVREEEAARWGEAGVGEQL